MLTAEQIAVIAEGRAYLAPQTGHGHAVGAELDQVFHSAIQGFAEPEKGDGCGIINISFSLFKQLYLP